ncbi:MAG: DegV family protein [Chloroflexota bacterium]
MSKVAVITDSTAYLPPDLREKHNVTVVPQVLIWGDETLKDGVDIQPDEFYTRLKTAKIMPSTSQVSIPDMQNIFTGLLDQDYDILGIFISSKFSGTISSATQARDALGLGEDKIAIVDSNSTAMAMGFMAIAAARFAGDGASLSECVALAEKARSHTGVFFVVDTLEFLYRGGRIGGASRFLGSALNLKPILAVQDGRVEAVERVRTKGKAVDRMLELVKEQVGDRKPVRMATLHANAAQEAREILERAGQMMEISESVFSEVSPVVGTHAGPGTVGLAFMAGM